MCFLPKLNQIKKKTQTIATFRGLNERKSIADGEFSDCCNISLEEYPAVSVMDGYSQYDESLEATGTYRLRSKKNVMILEKDTGSNLTITATIIKQSNSSATTSQITIYNGNSGEFILSDFDVYNDTLVVFCYLYEAEAMYTRQLIVYENPKKEIDVNNFVINNPGSVVSLMAFGSRLIILDGTSIHISYDNDISEEKWETYSENGELTAKCAQEIQLLDDGDFTCGVNYLDYPIFFKKNSMYMLLGEYNPFSLTRIDSVGCPYPDSIAICNGKLYFLSDLGVMEYDGGTPELISQNIKLNNFNAATQSDTVYSYHQQYAFSDNRYYYIGEYIYDTYTKAWSKQKIGDTYIYPQCFFNNDRYLKTVEYSNIPGESSYSIVSLFRSSDTELSDWYFTTKQFHEYQEGKKIISKLIIGFEKENTTALKIEVSLNKGAFQTVYTWDGTIDFVKEVPVLLPPCDYFQVRVKGTGKTIVHYIKREFRVLGV